MVKRINIQKVKRFIELVKFKAGKTEKEVARDLGITAVQLSRLKNKGNKTLERIAFVAEKYGITGDEILEALLRDYGQKKKN